MSSKDSSIREVESIWWDYFAVTGAQFLLIPLGFLSTSLTSRFLGAKGYGIIGLALSVTQFLTGFTANWTATSIVRFGKEEFIQHGSLRKVVGSRFMIISLPCIAVTGLFMLVLRQTIADYIEIASSNVWTIFLFVLAMTLAIDTNYILQAIGLMKQSGFGPVMQRLAYLLLLLGLMLGFRGRLRPEMVILAMVLSWFAQVLFGFIFVQPRCIWPWQPDLITAGKIARYAWPLMFNLFVGMYAVNWIDLYIVKRYLSLEEVGIYQAAYQGMLYTSRLLSGIGTVAFPLLVSLKSHSREDLVTRYISRFIPQFVFLWSLFMSLVLMLSGPFYNVMFGREYAAGLLPFAILLITPTYQGISTVYSPLFATYDLLFCSTLINACMSLINMWGDLMLVKPLGMTGAALATAVAYIYGAIMYLIIINRFLSIKRYAALLSPIPALVALLVCLATMILHWRVLAISLLIMVSLVVARYSKLFQREDLSILGGIDMPPLIRQGIKRVFLALST